MAASYLWRGITEWATFSLFVRRLPRRRGFLIGAGLADCLDFLEGFRFSEEDLVYAGTALGFGARDLEAFRRLRFTGDVWAIPEGRVVLACEPLPEVTAPLPEAQLVETALLNLVSFQTCIASKAARCRMAAQGRELVDFAFRRTQGLEAGLAVARLSALVGFSATSNVEAARLFGLRPVPWRTRSSRPSQTRARPSGASLRTSRAGPPSSWTPTTPWRACARLPSSSASSSSRRLSG
jgi:nicotinate phosphoribosyltransferase